MEQKFTRDMIFGGNVKTDNDEDIINKENINIIDTPVFSIDIVTDEILTLKNNIAINIIEIGKKLNKVKDNIDYGEFSKWLEEKVQFSQRTAEKFMKIAKEFSDSTQMSILGQRKLYLLAGIENELREEIIRENNVEKITSNEIEKIIKDKNGIDIKSKFTGKIKKDTYKKYKDRFDSNDDFDLLVNKLLENYFKQ